MKVSNGEKACKLWLELFQRHAKEWISLFPSQK